MRAGQRTDSPHSTGPLQLSSGVLAGRVLHRRGIALWTLGRYPPALDDLRRAVGVLQRAGDQLWTARALSARGAGLPGGRLARSRGR